jgi:hypothetical protein
MTDEIPDVDGELKKLLGAQQAAAQQAAASLDDLIGLVARVRVGLMMAGFPQETATGMAHDCFCRLLDLLMSHAGN